MTRRAIAFRLGARAGRAGTALVLLVAVSTCHPRPAEPWPVRCRKGALDGHERVFGYLGASSCAVVDRSGRSIAWYDTWSLRADTGRVYVLRIVPDQDELGRITWHGRTTVLARDEDGTWAAPLLSTRPIGPPGRASASREYIVAPERPQDLLFRIATQTPGDSGAYLLELQSCPAPRIEDTTIVATADSGCRIGGIGARTVRFFWTGPAAPGMTLTLASAGGTFRAWRAEPARLHQCLGRGRGCEVRLVAPRKPIRIPEGAPHGASLLAVTPSGTRKVRITPGARGTT